MVELRAAQLLVQAQDNNNLGGDTPTMSYNSRRANLGRIAIYLIFGMLVVLLSPGRSVADVERDYEEGRTHVKERGLSQVGSRYRYGGDSPREGFDCSGLTTWVYGDHAADLPRRSIDQWRLRNKPGYKRVWKRKNLQKGDLVFHKTTSAPVGHVGIYIGRGRFVSTTSSSGVKVNSIYDKSYWGRRYVGGVRVPSLRTK